MSIPSRVRVYRTINTIYRTSTRTRTVALLRALLCCTRVLVLVLVLYCTRTVHGTDGVMGSRVRVLMVLVSYSYGDVSHDTLGHTWQHLDSRRTVSSHQHQGAKPCKARGKARLPHTTLAWKEDVQTPADQLCTHNKRPGEHRGSCSQASSFATMKPSTLANSKNVGAESIVMTSFRRSSPMQVAAPRIIASRRRSVRLVCNSSAEKARVAVLGASGYTVSALM